MSWLLKIMIVLLCFLVQVLFMFHNASCPWVVAHSTVFRGLQDHTHHKMLTSKIFNTISAYLCSCSCRHCYNIKQNYCIFFSPKAFCVCDTQKVLKRRLWPGLHPGYGWGSSRRSPDPVVGWEGGHPLPTPRRSSTSLASWYRCRQCLISVNPSKFFFCIWPW